MQFFKTTFAAITLAIFAQSPNASYATESSPPSITVTGTGIVSVAPDMAIVTVGVMREDQTARAALDANNAAMENVLAEMKSAGIEERDLQTSNFNIQPRYFYPKRKSNGEQPAPQITGYVVSNTLSIRIRDLDLTGSIMDKVVSLGVNSGGGIRFTNANTKEILSEARTKAVANAISKAETLTSSASVGLGKILSISESGNRPRPVALHQARSMAVQEDAGAVPFASGENEYQISVTISWAIEQ